MQEFPGTIYEWSGKYHDAEAKEILDLITSCISAFELLISILKTEDYPKPERSALLKLTDSLHIPTGPEPKVTIAMVTETMNKFTQWTEVLGNIDIDDFHNFYFVNECEINIENYRIDTKYLTRELRRLVKELRLGKMASNR